MDLINRNFFFKLAIYVNIFKFYNVRELVGDSSGAPGGPCPPLGKTNF